MAALPWRGALLALTGAIAMQPASAADPTPNQAQLLQDQLQAAVGGLVGTPSRPIRVVPQGDHYELTMPIGQAGTAVTAQATRNAGGVWAINDIRMPSPFDVTVESPAAGAGNPTKLHVTGTIAEQSANALFDPSSATPSSFSGSNAGVQIAVDGAKQHQSMHFDASETSVDSSPVTDGKVDETQRIAITGYTGEIHSAGEPDLHLAARHLDLQAHVSALSPSQRKAANLAATALFASMPAAGGSGGLASLKAIDRGAAHRLVLALQNVMTGFDITQTVDGLHVTAGGSGVDIDHASLGLAAASPAEMLDAHLDLAISGISAPSVAIEKGGDLIPHHATLRVVLSGISMHDLSGLALAGTEPDPDLGGLMMQFATLFTHGGLGFGLENVSVDVGPAEFAGELHVTATGMAENGGAGRITAKGLDALIARVKQLPQAQGVLPLMTRLRDLGRSDGDSLVWDLRLQDSKLLVNGVDLSAPPPVQKL